MIQSGYHANVSVNVEDAFVGPLLIKFGQNELLHSKHDSIFAADPDGCAGSYTKTHTGYTQTHKLRWEVWKGNKPAVLHRLHGVLHLEDPTIGGEGGGRQVILRDTQTHCYTIIHKREDECESTKPGVEGFYCGDQD